jgi:hypothetical protein
MSTLTGTGYLVDEIKDGGIVRLAGTSAGLTLSVTAYTSGDQLGEQITLAGAARNQGGGGYITGIVLIDAADVMGAVDVVFSRASITPAANNAPATFSDADALNIVGVVSIVAAGVVDLGGNRTCSANSVRIPYDCGDGTALYVNLITRTGNAVFAAVTDLRLVVYVEPR